ncbi:hypothetical protein ACVWWO_001766 [Bradyrhizobium sp. F1.13.1]
MTIAFEKLKARLLANPKVKAEYDALAPEFEIAAELLRARLRAGLSQAEPRGSDGHQSIYDCPARKWPDPAQHQNASALRRGDRQQDACEAFGSVMQVNATSPHAGADRRSVQQAAGRVGGGRALPYRAKRCWSPHSPSSRAQRSNPASVRGGSLDCFVARAPRNDGEIAGPSRVREGCKAGSAVRPWARAR